MPVMNGFKLYQLIKEIDNKAKVLFATAYLNYDGIIKDYSPHLLSKKTNPILFSYLVWLHSENSSNTTKTLVIQLRHNFTLLLIGRQTKDTENITLRLQSYP
jgi:hypothetical protein